MKTIQRFFQNEEKRTILLLILSAVSLILSLCKVGAPFDMAWISAVLCGIPIIWGAIVGLITKFDMKADVLVSIALIASLAIGEIFAAGEVAFIMALGALLEEHTVSKARRGLESLVSLKPQAARVVRQGEEQTILADEVKIGDILRVFAGETIPVDGVIQEGNTSIDQSVMTGESLPVDKNVGDTVYSGTLNQYGAFDMKATKVGEDSSLQKMIRLVQSADADRAKIVGLADRWATWIVVIALASAIATYFITQDIIRAVTILVVFCPCGLVLATPTAIMAAIGNLTKKGILVREGDALERLAKVSHIAFDKTGTLTYGKLSVVEVYCHDNRYSKQDLLRYAASVEQRSEHPLGKAVVACYRTDSNEALPQPESFSMMAGRGIRGIVEGKGILAGSRNMIEEEGLSFSPKLDAEIECACHQGGTVIVLAIDHTIAGFLVLSDRIREESGSVISHLKESGIDSILLTGDNPHAANQIAQQAGVSNWHAQCLPEDKLEEISAYQKEGKMICMVGDGVNDAPALKKAYVGVAMGGIGSDIAIDAADIALLRDDIKEIPHMMQLSRHMMQVIKANLAISLILNFVAIILAMTGILNPVVGALVHNVGSVVVIVNSSLLLKWRGKREKGKRSERVRESILDSE